MVKYLCFCPGTLKYKQTVLRLRTRRRRVLGNLKLENGDRRVWKHSKSETSPFDYNTYMLILIEHYTSVSCERSQVFCWLIEKQPLVRRKSPTISNLKFKLMTNAQWTFQHIEIKITQICNRFHEVVSSSFEIYFCFAIDSTSLSRQKCLRRPDELRCLLRQILTSQQLC